MTQPALAKVLACLEWALQAILALRMTNFSQVTNPPIDPLREGLVMSLEMRLGSRGNLLQPSEGAYSQVCSS